MKSVAREKTNLLSDDLFDVLQRDVKKNGLALREFSAGRSTSLDLGTIRGQLTLTMTFKSDVRD